MPDREKALDMWAAQESTSQEIAEATGYADDASLRGSIHRARRAGDKRAIVKERFTGRVLAHV